MSRGAEVGARGRPVDGAVRVDLGARSYDVRIGEGVLGGLGEGVRAVSPGGSACALVVDEGLPGEIVEGAVGSLESAGFRVVRSGVRAAEREKSLATLERVLGELTSARLERSEPVVTLGGGIVGDVGGKASGVYRRGVALVQCPTTLLAMVDASVGGKTGVNLVVKAAGGGAATLRKNMAGVFHQPRLVLADVGALSTLPARELRCGLAECIKHAVLSADWGDAGLLEWTEANAGAAANGDTGVLVELIRRNVAVKAAVVAADEREEAVGERSGRAVLNLGHTFAHALEAVETLSPDGDPAHAPLRHGEAVALGLVAACECAHSLGMCGGDLVERVRGLLGAVGLPTAVGGLPGSERVLELMADDKKVAAGVLRLVVPSGVGRCRVVVDPPARAVLDAIDAVRAGGA